MWSILGTAVVLLTASAFRLDLGLPTFVCAALAALITTRAKLTAMKEIGAGVAWSVLPLVAGLFVIVEAVQGAGALQIMQQGLRACMALPSVGGALAASFSVAALSNLVNNLPSGLMAPSAERSVDWGGLGAKSVGNGLACDSALAHGATPGRGGDYSRSVSESRAGCDAACAAFSDCRGGSAFLEWQNLFANRVEIDAPAFHIGDVS